MAMRFQELAGIEPFGIDQLPTVSLDPSRWPGNVPITHELRDALLVLDGTAGFSWVVVRDNHACVRRSVLPG
jgi:hypothetical protein